MRACFPSPQSFHCSYCCCSSSSISREHDPRKAERAASAVAVTSCKIAASRMRQWCAWMIAAVLCWHRHKQSCNHSQVQRWEFWGIKATPAPVALGNFQPCSICFLKTICHSDKLPTWAPLEQATFCISLTRPFSLLYNIHFQPHMRFINGKGCGNYGVGTTES